MGTKKKNVKAKEAAEKEELRLEALALKKKEEADKAAIEEKKKKAKEKEALAAAERQEKKDIAEKDAADKAAAKAAVIAAAKEAAEKAADAKEKGEKAAAKEKEEKAVVEAARLKRAKLAAKEKEAKAKIESARVAAALELANKAAIELNKKALAKKAAAEKARCQARERQNKGSIKKKYPKKAAFQALDRYVSWDQGSQDQDEVDDSSGSAYAQIAVHYKASVCTLEGRLRVNKKVQCSSADQCKVGEVKAQACWPKRDMHFTSNHGGEQLSVTLKTNGFLFLGSLQPKDWISLSGITWARESNKDNSQAIIEASSWKSLSVAPHKPMATKQGTLCMLSGMFSSSSWMLEVGKTARIIAKLPESCRPTSRLMFSAQAFPDVGKGEELRVDLHKNGDVEVLGVEGRPLETKVSLDGISFQTVVGDQMKLARNVNAWSKDEYAAPQAHSANSCDGSNNEKCVTGMCSVQGLLRVSKLVEGMKLATLPEGCRPRGIVSFNAPHNRRVMQLDVSELGVVTLVKSTEDASSPNSGSAKDQFISLSSVNFPVPMEAALEKVKVEC